MGWFDEQIRNRRKADDELFSSAFAMMNDAILGTRLSNILNSERGKAKDAIDAILKYYHVKSRELPESIQTVDEQLEYLLRPSGIMRRTVTLSKGWEKDAIGAMLATTVEGDHVVALIPEGASGYWFQDDKTGKKTKVTAKNESLFSAEAIAFYKPLPLKKLAALDLLAYAFGTLGFTDYLLYGLALFSVTLIGLGIPKMNNLLFSSVLESGSLSALLGVGVFFVSLLVSRGLMDIVQKLYLARIQNKMGLAVQAASMMRLLTLPVSFFRNYSAGELSTYIQYLNQLCTVMVSAVMSTGLGTVFSFVYVFEIFYYAPALVAPALLVTFSVLVVSILTTIIRMHRTEAAMKASALESGMNYAMISGIQKIKLAGAEKRAFARWGEAFSKSVYWNYGYPAFIVASSAITSAITLAGMVVIYYIAVKTEVSIADFYSFYAAYGMASSSILSLAGVVSSYAMVRPILNMVRPILETVPEIGEDKKVIAELKGGIELSHVSFRYKSDMPLILNDISLKIRPGQYVAIVGKTGCGKSTLLRLLLGFEQVNKGAIYYDDHDLKKIDKKSLRRKIGVVLQNGSLFRGSICENILVAAPGLGMDAAWEAAELAGLKADIEAMPMGMYTMVVEDGGGISGGQKQRMMIARAVAAKPKILFLDEATSALDNLTQKHVSDALDGLSCTRIVVAHRLSTIRHCDRIIVLEGGKVVEDGTYDELIGKKGFFAELVDRQRIE